MRSFVLAILLLPALAVGEPTKLDTTVTVRVDDDNKALAATFKEQLALKQGTRADACWHKAGRAHAKLGFDDGKVTSVAIDQLDEKTAKDCITKVLKAIVLANAHGHSTADVLLEAGDNLDSRSRKALDRVLDSQLTANLSKFQGIKGEPAGSGPGTGVGTGTGGGGTADGEFVSGGRVAGGPNEPKVTVGPFDSSKPAADGELSSDDINRVMRARAGVFRACYQKELARAPKLAGKVVVLFKIRPEGTVATAKVETTTLKSAAVESCLLSQIMRLRFPAKAEATVHYPLVFALGS
jgi:hypothetical protein